MSSTLLHRPSLRRPSLRRSARPQLAPDQLWAIGVMALAAVAAVLAVVGAYDLGAVVALACVLAGGWSMYVSESISERFETVVATGVGAVALAACLAYGSGMPGALLL